MPTPISISILTSIFFQETAMSDVEAGELGKIVKRKTHLRVIYIFKKFVSAIKIIKCILDLGISLIIGGLLASAPAIEKQLTKAITKKKTMQFQMKNFELNTIDS